MSLSPVTGSVIDAYGKPLSGIVVTLHVMGYNETSGRANTLQELYDLKTTTYACEPFPEGFVFDNIELVPGHQ